MYQILLDTNANIGNGLTTNNMTKAVSDLNNTFTTAVQYAGYVVIAFAIIKVIMAMSDQSPQSKSQASMLFGGGIVMVAFASVLKSLNISSTTGEQDMLKNVLKVIGSGLTYVGIILVVFAIFRMVVSMMNTSAEEKASASMMLASGIACLAGSTFASGIWSIFFVHKTSNEAWTQLVSYVAVGIIGRVATYIGAGMLVFGIYHFFIGMKDEDSHGKMQASMEIGVAIALMSAVAIISAVTGITTTNIVNTY